VEETDVKKLIALRKHVISEYTALDGKREPSAIIKQSDVAYSLETIIRSIEDILRPHVQFEK
tara:strand:- start:402 stop:587 length:186 start_codon:yes stop_codon:yes gene_type:complete